jgi:hypothetical protein
LPGVTCELLSCAFFLFFFRPRAVARADPTPSCALALSHTPQHHHTRNTHTVSSSGPRPPRPPAPGRLRRRTPGSRPGTTRPSRPCAGRRLMSELGGTESCVCV